jgi:hypothetical protein
MTEHGGGRDRSEEPGGRALLFLNEVAGGRKLLRTVRERHEDQAEAGRKTAGGRQERAPYRGPALASG